MTKFTTDQKELIIGLMLSVVIFAVAIGIAIVIGDILALSKLGKFVIGLIAGFIAGQIVGFLWIDWWLND